MKGELIAMGLGILGSLAVHLAKGMQKHVFILHRQGKSKKLLTFLYSISFIFNNAFGFFMIPATKFAPPSYFSSMFAVGLLGLMFYSHFLLKEKVSKIEVLGVLILIMGTLILGVDNVLREAPSFHLLQKRGFLVSAYGGTLLLLFFVLLTKSSHHLLVKSLFFGAFSGFLNGLDPLMKALGQISVHGMTYLPQHKWGWVIFGTSFFFGTGSFLMTQYSFKKRIPASLVIPVHNAFFIFTPLLLQIFWLPGFFFSGLSLLGVGCIIGGLGVMNWRANQKKRIS